MTAVEDDGKNGWWRVGYVLIERFRGMKLKIWVLNHCQCWALGFVGL